MTTKQLAASERSAQVRILPKPKPILSSVAWCSWSLTVEVPSDRKITRKSRTKADRAVVSQHKFVRTPEMITESTYVMQFFLNTVKSAYSAFSEEE